MEKLKKWVALLLIGVFGILMMAGCSNSGSGKQTTSVLQKVVQSRTLTVGILLNFPPFGFKDANGNPDGYDVDIAKALAASLNAKVKFVELTADARVTSVQTGRVDVSLGNFTRTLERAQAIDFTNPYVVAGERMIVKKGSGITKLADLNGKKVAVTKGSTDADIIKAQVPGALISFFTNSSDSLQAVKNGQVVCFVEDSNFLQYEAKLNPNLEVVGDSLVSLEYNAIGVKQGDSEWMSYLNMFVYQINTDGTNKALYKKWFGVDMPFPLNPQY